jgi:dGTPase
MYNLRKDFARLKQETESDYRSPIRRDYGRLLHSPSFRRLQGKTQLYPGIESDFFRNRLTHSLEVAQIAKTIALRLNHTYFHSSKNKIDPDICEFAGLAHDLGHPPFGHQGEEALDEIMRDAGGFEGNAQTLRILSKLEKKRINGENTPSKIDDRLGLNLTFRTLASILKYDNIIPVLQSDRVGEAKNHPIKGYYFSEKDLVRKIKKQVIGDENYINFKTVECQIMDVADDIAYSTYDLEDGLKAGFYHPTSMFTYPNEVYDRIALKVSKAIKHTFSRQNVIDKLQEIFTDIFGETSLDANVWNIVEDTENNQYLQIKADFINTAFAERSQDMNLSSQSIAKNGELRTSLTSKLVNEAIEGVYIIEDMKNPSQSKIELDPNIRIRVEILKNFTYESQIQSPRLKVAEYRGKQIIKDLFDALSQNDGWRLLPEDFQNSHKECKSDIERKRCICDFIAGMTDKYAIEFYGRLKSENPETIFKPF